MTMTSGLEAALQAARAMESAGKKVQGAVAPRKRPRSESGGGTDDPTARIAAFRAKMFETPDDAARGIALVDATRKGEDVVKVQWKGGKKKSKKARGPGGGTESEVAIPQVIRAKAVTGSTARLSAVSDPVTVPVARSKKPKKEKKKQNVPDVGTVDVLYSATRALEALQSMADTASLTPTVHVLKEATEVGVGDDVVKPKEDKKTKKKKKKKKAVVKSEAEVSVGDREALLTEEALVTAIAKGETKKTKKAKENKDTYESHAELCIADGAPDMNGEVPAAQESVDDKKKSKKKKKKAACQIGAEFSSGDGVASKALPPNESFVNALGEKKTKAKMAVCQGEAKLKDCVTGAAEENESSKLLKECNAIVTDAAITPSSPTEQAVQRDATRQTSKTKTMTVSDDRQSESVSKFADNSTDASENSQLYAQEAVAAGESDLVLAGNNQGSDQNTRASDKKAGTNTSTNTKMRRKKNKKGKKVMATPVSNFAQPCVDNAVVHSMFAAPVRSLEATVSVAPISVVVAEETAHKGEETTFSPKQTKNKIAEAPQNEPACEPACEQGNVEQQNNLNEEVSWDLDDLMKSALRKAKLSGSDDDDSDDDRDALKHENDVSSVELSADEDEADVHSTSMKDSRYALFSDLIDEAARDRWELIEVGRLVRIFSAQWGHNREKTARFIRRCCPELVSVDFLEGLNINLSASQLLSILDCGSGTPNVLMNKLASAVENGHLSVRDDDFLKFVEKKTNQMATNQEVLEFLMPLLESLSNVAEVGLLIKGICTHWHVDRTASLVQEILLTSVFDDLDGHQDEILVENPALTGRLDFPSRLDDEDADENGNLKGLIANEDSDLGEESGSDGEEDNLDEKSSDADEDSDDSHAGDEVYEGETDSEEEEMLKERHNPSRRRRRYRFIMDEAEEGEEEEEDPGDDEMGDFIANEEDCDSSDESSDDECPSRQVRKRLRRA